MVDRLDQLLSRAKRSSTVFAVLFMDIDRFKDVNDSHGHEFGDLLLRAVAQRLAKSVRQSDTVARIGGDEFVIILETAQRDREADGGRHEGLQAPGQAVHSGKTPSRGDRQHRHQLLSGKRARYGDAAAGGRLRHVPGQEGGRQSTRGMPPGLISPGDGFVGRRSGLSTSGSGERSAARRAAGEGASVRAGPPRSIRDIGVPSQGRSGRMCANRPAPRISRPAGRRRSASHGRSRIRGHSRRR